MFLPFQEKKACEKRIDANLILKFVFRGAREASMSLKLRAVTRCLRVLAIVIIVLSCNIANAQFLSDIPDINLGSVRLAPFVQAGYRNISFNLNLPFRVTPVDQYDGSLFNGPPTMDLALSNVGAWVGAVGIDARITPNLFMALKADGIIPNNNVRVRLGEHFSSWWDTSQPFDWNGQGLEWWDADCMLGFNFFRDWSATLGLRYDRLTLSLQKQNPYSLAGIIQSDRAQDVVAETWIPYVGLRLDQPYYYAYLLYSPLASTTVTAPMSAMNTYNVAVPLPYDSEVDYYRFTNGGGGQFFEAFLNYSFISRQTLNLDVWAKGSWMWFKGNGEWSFYEQDLMPGHHNAIFPSQSVSGNFNTHALSAGLAATLAF